MAPNRRRKPIALKLGQDPASLPLKHPPREIFAQAVARGVNVDVAYREAGYNGGPASRRELRCSADVDGRIRWLLAQRIEADAEARARLIEREQDARTRLIRELEAVAYVDIGDIVQWDRDPQFDSEGKLVGWKDRMEITPSRLLTKAQRAAVKSMTKHTTKNGTTLRIDTNGRLEAMAQLARILGFATEAPGSVTNKATVNVGRVNIGQDNGLEALRRLAYAIEKTARAEEASEKAAIEAKPIGGNGENGQNRGISSGNAEIDLEKPT